jgi:hypothetical protein
MGVSVCEKRLGLWRVNESNQLLARANGMFCKPDDTFFNPFSFKRTEFIHSSPEPAQTMGSQMVNYRARTDVSICHAGFSSKKVPTASNMFQGRECVKVSPMHFGRARVHVLHGAGNGQEHFFPFRNSKSFDCFPPDQCGQTLRRL